MWQLYFLSSVITVSKWSPFADTVKLSSLTVLFTAMKYRNGLKLGLYLHPLVPALNFLEHSSTAVFCFFFFNFFFSCFAFIVGLSSG